MLVVAKLKSKLWLIVLNTRQPSQMLLLFIANCCCCCCCCCLSCNYKNNNNNKLSLAANINHASNVRIATLGTWSLKIESGNSDDQSIASLNPSHALARQPWLAKRAARDIMWPSDFMCEAQIQRSQSACALVWKQNLHNSSNTKQVFSFHWFWLCLCLRLRLWVSV